MMEKLLVLHLILFQQTFRQLRAALAKRFEAMRYDAYAYNEVNPYDLSGNSSYDKLIINGKKYDVLHIKANPEWNPFPVPRY